MKIIYVSKGTAPSTFERLLKKYNNKLQQQSQKYNELLMEGLANNGVEVESISTRPINRNIEKRIFFSAFSELENNIKYYYCPFINLPVLRNISIFFSVLFQMIKDANRETVVFCDALNIAAAFAVIIAGKIRKIVTVGIVTDVPCYRPNNEKPPLHERVNLFVMKKFDRFLLLTEQMNQLVNLKKKPYIVLEGHADIEMEKKANSIELKGNSMVCMYAGSLRKIYGISNLVQGFLAANINNTELHIYGSGDYESELTKISNEYNTVVYHGTAPNTEIVEREIAATLLINPRPTNEEFTKYSFPSKNMEYMASGTPVLTTNLPGMPMEYKDYVYIADDESAKGFQSSLTEILQKSREELHKKGLSARDYVLKNKNNNAQAKKVLNELIGDLP